YLPMGRKQLSRHCARQGDAHGGKTVRDDTGIRPLTAIETSNPQLVSTNVRNHKVLRIHRYSQLTQQALGLDRKALIRVISFKFCYEGFPQRPGAEGLVGGGSHSE